MPTSIVAKAALRTPVMKEPCLLCSYVLLLTLVIVSLNSLKFCGLGLEQPSLVQITWLESILRYVNN